MALDALGGGDAGAMFDFERLTAISDGDTEFERELAGEYLAQARQLLDQIGEALERGDVEVVRRHAHTLKGSSRTVGADALGSSGAELEQAAGHAEAQVVTALLARARTRLDSTQGALDGYFGSDTYRNAA